MSKYYAQKFKHFQNVMFQRYCNESTCKVCLYSFYVEKQRLMVTIFVHVKGLLSHDILRWTALL